MNTVFSKGKREIIVIISGHFSDKGRQGDASGRAERLVGVAGRTGM
jgi:hypothetical protein